MCVRFALVLSAVAMLFKGTRGGLAELVLYAESSVRARVWPSALRHKHSVAVMLRRPP